VVKTVASEAKIIAKHGLIYGLANILDRIISFLMIPVYTRFLTPSDYGILELLYITSSVLAIFIGVGIESAVGRFYFDYKEQKDRNMVISTAYIGFGLLAIMVIGSILPFTDKLAVFILDSSELGHLFMISLITLGLGFVIPISIVYLRVQQKSMTILTIQGIKTAVTLGLNIYFVVILERGVEGILSGTLIATAMAAVVLSVFTFYKTGLHINLKLLKNMVIFGLPLVPSQISALIVQVSDRYFIKTYADMNLTGLYSIGYKFGSLINQFVTSPFIQIWTPRRFEYFDQENSQTVYARIFTYFCAVSIFVGLAMSIFAKEVIFIMTTEKFYSAYKIVPVVVLSYIVFSFHYHFNIGILIRKKTKYIAYTNIINGALNLILNFILIKKFDIWGAAFATLICFIFKSSLVYYFSNRLYKIIVEWRRVLPLFGIAFAIFFASLLIETGTIYYNIAIKIGLVGLFPILLYLFKTFDEDEIKRIKQIIFKRKFEFNQEM